MLHGHRLLLLGCLALGPLSGCGSSSYSSSLGAAAVAAGGTTSGTAGTSTPGFNGPSIISGTHDLVVATASAATVAVVVGANQTVSVTFASSDGMPMSGFSISGAAGALPPGWNAPNGFTCAVVTTGSGCVLNLQYAPAAVDSGTLTVGYVVVDDSGLARTNGSITIAYVATAHNNVVAMASPTGEIDAVIGAGASPVSVNFITDDGNAAANFAVTTDLGSLPAGWTSTSPSVACPIVSTGSGCQLALTYAPTAAGSGTLTLNYGYSDDSGASKTGTLNIPYRTTSADNVIATASPTGEVIAVQKTGGQAVTVTFTTDDGKPASQLQVTSDLTKLPPGWSSTAHSFACNRLSTGNACQLPLTYAPAALASGTLTLNYAYTDDSGMAKTALLNVAYAATTNDNVVGTASPAGQINAVVGLGTQAVAVAFTTDDGRPATALQLTSDLTRLPAGWSSTAGSFACSGINADMACTLPLTYAPTAAGSGTLSLVYSYLNDAGESKTGTVNIAYRATTNDNVVGTPNQSSLAVRTGSNTTVTVTFTTDDGNPASGLSVTTDLTSLPSGWNSPSNSFTCPSVSVGTSCVLSLNLAPTVAVAGTLSLGFGYTNDAGFMKTGTVSIAYNAITPYLYVANDSSTDLSTCPVHADNSVAACTTTGFGFAAPDGIALNGSYAYVTNNLGDGVSRCTLDAGGTLTGCAATGGAFAAPTSIAINPAGTFAYIEQTTGLSVCAIAASDGSLSGCTAAGTAFAPLIGIALSAGGNHAYSVHGSSSIDVCSIAVDGSLAACAATGGNASQAVAALAVQNNHLYVSTSVGSLYVCPLNADATVGSCQSTAVGTNAAGLAFIGSTAYVSTLATTVLACPVNADGSFGICTTQNDPTFNGTAGMAVR